MTNATYPTLRPFDLMPLAELNRLASALLLMVDFDVAPEGFVGPRLPPEIVAWREGPPPPVRTFVGGWTMPR
jgi:hypothetical protein